MSEYNKCCVPDPVSDIVVSCEGGKIKVSWTFTPNENCTYVYLEIDLRHAQPVEPDEVSYYDDYIKKKVAATPGENSWTSDMDCEVDHKYFARINAQFSCGKCAFVQSNTYKHTEV